MCIAICINWIKRNAMTMDQKRRAKYNVGYWTLAEIISINQQPTTTFSFANAKPKFWLTLFINQFICLHDNVIANILMECNETKLSNRKGKRRVTRMVVVVVLVFAFCWLPIQVNINIAISFNFPSCFFCCCCCYFPLQRRECFFCHLKINMKK